MKKKTTRNRLVVRKESLRRISEESSLKNFVLGQTWGQCTADEACPRPL